MRSTILSSRVPERSQHGRVVESRKVVLCSGSHVGVGALDVAQDIPGTCPRLDCWSRTLTFLELAEVSGCTAGQSRPAGSIL